MRDKMETVAVYLIGVPVVLLFTLLYWVCRLFGVRLEEDF